MSLPEPLQVIVVRTPGCHLCEDALTALRELGGDGSVRVDVVEADSTRGQALIGEHRPGMFPLVLADGRLLCAGRLPRGKLARLLEQRLQRFAAAR